VKKIQKSLLKAPSFWQSNNIISWMLWPLSYIYYLVSRAVYAATPPRRLNVPVICVGNLVMGGAGKTPTVIAIVEMLKAAGHNPHILSRGYGRDLKQDQTNGDIRPLAKPAYNEEMQGAYVAQNRNVHEVHEDSSTGATPQLPLEVGFGRRSNVREPNLMDYLDLVALATVCDVMPLTGINRAFVSQGLKVMRKRQNLGLRTLADVAGVYEKLSAYHLGFMLGPRINAGGRVGKSDLGSKLLTTQNEAEAKDIANILHHLNQQRQEIEKDVLTQALAQVESMDLLRHPLLLVCGQNWHPGVVGIVASRLKDRYHRPACVVGFDGDNGKGSGRSVSGICLGTAMHMAVRNGVLEKGGGHAMAAGFSLNQSQYNDFYDFLKEYFAKFMADYKPVLHLDAHLSIGGVDGKLIESIKQLEPYGQGNYMAKFVFNSVYVNHTTTVGENHLKCQLSDQSGKRIKAMAFRAKNSVLGDFLEESYKNKKLINIAGSLLENNWQGNIEYLINIDDASA